MVTRRQRASAAVDGRAAPGSNGRVVRRRRRTPGPSLTARTHGRQTRRTGLLGPGIRTAPGSVRPRSMTKGRSMRTKLLPIAVVLAVFGSTLARGCRDRRHAGRHPRHDQDAKRRLLGRGVHLAAPQVRAGTKDRGLTTSWAPNRTPATTSGSRATPRRSAATATSGTPATRAGSGSSTRAPARPPTARQTRATP